ncbi:DUF362 domain-containing protein [Haliangium ochraceum]|uniref:DUF362 domain-containing protein n=1 Tax=Haliangium ochraceum (strain DSM 14365 / JCM 11303 / SMP-2) TaxID=502025 RepID=D0LW83_HALO1|nr:DUF362 domain-containing protein [Haliangium ochraceum]ACY16015.1 protein of unknown function DUF362 [Haliangium ochraceum DSM 14365]
MRIPTEPKVILRDCRTYDVARIREIVADGMRTLGVVPSGRTLVKPNLVAAGEMFPHAHTRAEFGEGVLRAIRDLAGEGMEELAVGERCGITIPTRMSFRESGWDDALARVDGVKRYCFEEVPQVEIPLRHPQRLRDYVFTPEPVARADCFINLPKFKAHPWTTVTFSMKNYIGIQDDRHRLIDHDHRLNEKVADLQFIIQPQFIAIDAIIAGEGRMLTPTPFELGMIIMGNSQVAIDAVCSAIIGLEPRSVEHIRLAEDYGFGTSDIARIDISGDLSLEQAKQRAQGFRVGLIRVEKYFEGTNVTAYAGPPPEREHSDYCWGGCPGAMQEAIEILRQYDEQCDAKLPHLHVVFGAYEGPIDYKPGEKVVFIGDCATWQGRIGDQLVDIRSLYRDRDTRDPHQAEHDDIYKKMATTTAKLVRNRGTNHMRLEGCPVSVAEQVLALVGLSDIKNPYMAPEQIVKFNRGYLGWRARSMVNRLMGKRYQRHGGFAERGEAAPEVGAASG